MEYLLKASAVVAIFYFCYNLFLQRDTFFQSNRWFLLLGLLIAFCIPFIVIPIYIEQVTTPIQDFIYVDNGLSSDTEASLNITQIISVLYIIGVVFFLTRFIIQVYSLCRVLIHNKKQKSNRFTFIETSSDLPPFSFFKWIVYNPNQFNEAELKQILTHEKAHAYQLHSIDILISQLATIILWFNPFMWLYKKTLQQNLEFIADNTAHHKANCKKSYQHLLLKTSLPNHQLALTNNFYNSLIKKRIVMLHKNKSKNRNLLKLTLILPLLALFIMSFNTKEIITYKDAYIPTVDLVEDATVSTEAETNRDEVKLNLTKTKETSFNTKASATKAKVATLKTEVIAKDHGDHEMVIITKDYTEAEFDKIKKQFAKEGLTVKFKSIKRNEKGEIIAIKIDVSSKSSNANYNTSSDDPISAIKISFDREGNNISIGNTTMIHSDDYVFETKDGKHKIHSKGKGSNTFVFSTDDDDENENVYIIKKDGKVHEIKKVNRTKDVHIISGDNHEIIDIDTGDDNKIVVKNGKVFKEWKHKGGDGVWVEKDGKLTIVGKGKGANKLFISGDSKNDPIFILDGKEISKKEMEALDTDTFEKIEVLKRDSATKEYGGKAEHGVVLITSKTKE